MTAYGAADIELLDLVPVKRYVTPHRVHLTERMYALAVRYGGLGERISLEKAPRRVQVPAPRPVTFPRDVRGRVGTQQSGGERVNGIDDPCLACGHARTLHVTHCHGWERMSPTFIRDCPCTGFDEPDVQLDLFAEATS